MGGLLTRHDFVADGLCRGVVPPYVSRFNKLGIGRQVSIIRLHPLFMTECILKPALLEDLVIREDTWREGSIDPNNVTGND